MPHAFLSAVIHAAINAAQPVSVTDANHRLAVISFLSEVLPGVVDTRGAANTALVDLAMDKAQGRFYIRELYDIRFESAVLTRCYVMFFEDRPVMAKVLDFREAENARPEVTVLDEGAFNRMTVFFGQLRNDWAVERAKQARSAGMDVFFASGTPPVIHLGKGLFTLESPRPMHIDDLVQRHRSFIVPAEPAQGPAISIKSFKRWVGEDGTVAEWRTSKGVVTADARHVVLALEPESAAQRVKELQKRLGEPAFWEVAEYDQLTPSLGIVRQYVPGQLAPIYGTVRFDVAAEARRFHSLYSRRQPGVLEDLAGVASYASVEEFQFSLKQGCLDFF